MASQVVSRWVMSCSSGFILTQQNWAVGWEGQSGTFSWYRFDILKVSKLMSLEQGEGIILVQALIFLQSSYCQFSEELRNLENPE